MPSLVTLVAAALVAAACCASIYFCVHRLATCRYADHIRLGQHVCVAIALVPLALALAWLTGVGYTFAMEQLQYLAISFLPEYLYLTVLRVSKIDGDVCLADVQIALCLLFTMYGFSVVRGHLIDIGRLLRISRRRFMRPDRNTQLGLQAVGEMKRAKAAALAATAPAAASKPPQAAAEAPSLRPMGGRRRW